MQSQAWKGMHAEAWTVGMRAVVRTLAVISVTIAVPPVITIASKSAIISRTAVALNQRAGKSGHNPKFHHVTPFASVIWFSIDRHQACFQRVAPLFRYNIGDCTGNAIAGPNSSICRQAARPSPDQTCSCPVCNLAFSARRGGLLLFAGQCQKHIYPWYILTYGTYFPEQTDVYEDNHPYKQGCICILCILRPV